METFSNVIPNRFDQKRRGKISAVYKHKSKLRNETFEVEVSSRAAMGIQLQSSKEMIFSVIFLLKIPDKTTRLHTR